MFNEIFFNDRVRVNEKKKFAEQVIPFYMDDHDSISTLQVKLSLSLSFEFPNLSWRFH